MTTDIMELWAEIAAGALPEGVGASITKQDPRVLLYVGNDVRHYVSEGSSDAHNRAAMLLIVDGWERQGWKFLREKNEADFDWLAFPPNWIDDPSTMLDHAHEREIIALGNVLAELGRSVKEGQA